MTCQVFLQTTALTSQSQRHSPLHLHCRPCLRRLETWGTGEAPRRFVRTTPADGHSAQGRRRRGCMGVVPMPAMSIAVSDAML
jgi:hypothetical protein